MKHGVEKRFNKNIKQIGVFGLFFMFLGIASTIVLTPLFSTHASAAINPQINFQGKLTNTDGTNVADGNYSIVFSIYTQQAPGGTNIWTETQPTVAVASGIFRVSLGSVTALPGSVDFNTNSIYLGVKVGTDAEMQPRVQFTASPYAFNADKVGGIAASGLVQLSPGSQQTGSINVNGSITTASTLAVQGASAVTLGSTTNVGAILFQDGTVNNRTVTLNVPALPTASYTLTLPTTAPAVSQCLQSGASTASQLVFGTCGGGGGTLQTAYTAGSAGTQTIAVTSTNGGVKIQDAASSIGTIFSVTSSVGAAYLGVTSSGVSVSALNAGSGLIQTTGGLTVTGVTGINTTGTSATTIGNSGATVAIASSSLNISSTGAISGVTGYTQGSGNFSVTGSGTFGTGTGLVGLNGATTITNANAAATSLSINSGTVVPTADQVVIDNTSSTGVTTSSVNGANVKYRGGSAAVEGSGIRVDYIPGGTSGGTWNGIRVVADATGAAAGVTQNGIKLNGPVTPGGGTETGLAIDSQWDIGIDIQSGGIQMLAQADPATPTGSNLRFYAKSIAGRVLPKWIGPSGVDTPVQANLGFNRISLINPAGGSTLTTFVGGYGSTFTNTGTANNPTPASTNLLTSTRRATFSSGVTAGTVASHRQSTLQVWRGNAAGVGGFFYTIRFGTETLAAGNRAFVGMSDSTAAPTNVDPTTTTAPGKIGVAINANTGNWKFVNNATGTAPTVTDLGTAIPVNTTDLYELVLFAAPNSTTINYRVTDLSTGGQVTNSVTTNIPSTTTFLAPQFWITNNATAAAAILDFGGWYLESDN